MTGGRGADVILDMVGGDYIERNYEAAAVEGRIVQIAFQGSPKATVDFLRIMLKRLTHTGSTLRARSVADKAAIARAVEERVLPLIRAGKVRPLIDSTFSLAQAAAAHARMETSAHIGKIVLVVDSRSHPNLLNFLLFLLRSATHHGDFRGPVGSPGPRNRRKVG